MSTAARTTSSRSPLTARAFSSTIRSIGAGLLCSGSLIGCGFEGLESPTHFVSDNYNDDVITLLGTDDLSGRYLKGSTVDFYLDRQSEEGSHQPLVIESSDPTLLRISEQQIEDDFSRSPSFMTQRFDVLSTGVVTLTFKDGDDVVLQRDVTLVEASSLNASRRIPSILQAEIESTAGRGEKVVSGREFSLRVQAMERRDGEEVEIDIASLTELPNVENAVIYQSNPSFSKGVRLHIKPELEGTLSIPVNVGDQQVDLRFNAVPADEIVGLTVAHELVTLPKASEARDSASQNETAAGLAVAVARDESGAPIFGAEVTWEQLGTNELGEEEVVSVSFGDQLNFPYSEGQETAFKVTAGGHSEVVYLPMNPESTAALWGGNAFGDGCDAQGRASESIILALVLMGIMIIKRRRHTTASYA